MTREQVGIALSGPIASVRTPFNRDGSIDYAGLRRSLEFDLSAGSRTLLLTYGDSLFSLLTDDEVADVTRAVVEHAAGRAMVVAADRAWATPKTVQFAQYAKDVGADLLMVLPPSWGATWTVDTLVEHYAAAARHIPVMVVTGVFSSAGTDFGLRVLSALSEQVEGIVAVKDDICGEFARRMSLLVRDKWAILSGGQKQNHLDLHPYGCDGYMSVFVTFRPDVAHAYWDHIQAGDLPRAKDVIAGYDMPFFEYVMALTGGFDAGIHGVLEICGIAKRWRRPPYYSLSDEEIERLADFLRRLPLVGEASRA